MSRVGHEHAVELVVKRIYSDEACTETYHNHSNDSVWETDQCYTTLLNSGNSSFELTCGSTFVSKTTWANGVCFDGSTVGYGTTYRTGVCLWDSLLEQYAKWECGNVTATTSGSDASTTFSATLLLVLGFLRLAA